MHADTKFRTSICSLVEALVEGHFDQLEQDGRSGQLSSHELKKALKAYGRTVIILPDETFDFVDVYPMKGQKTTWAVDVPLWAAEEGRSDLTLSLTVSESQDGVRLEIGDLHVLEHRKEKTSNPGGGCLHPGGVTNAMAAILVLY